jgi:hypothetical protein
VSEPSRLLHDVVKVKVKLKVILRPTVSRPVRLGVRHPSGTCDQFFFLLEIFFRQLRVCYFVAPSLARGLDCNLLLLLVLAAQSRSGLSPAGLKTIFYCPNFWDSPNLEGQVPVFISPRNKVAQIYPRALGSLSVASYDSQGCGGGILTRLHTGIRDIYLQNAGCASDEWLFPSLTTLANNDSCQQKKAVQSQREAWFV